MSLWAKFCSIGRWAWRSWPIVVISLLCSTHILAWSLLRWENELVNKVISASLQVMGGLIVLFAINQNLGLFRGHGLMGVFRSYLRDFPLFCQRPVISLSGAAFVVSGASATLTVGRVPGSLEERVAEAERRIAALHSEMHIIHVELLTKLSDTKQELVGSISANRTELTHLAARVENITIGGFRQQLFGVLLAFYGTALSLLAKCQVPSGHKPV